MSDIKLEKALEVIKQMEQNNVPEDAIVMAVEEMLHNDKSFKKMPTENQTITFDTQSLLKYIQYYSYEQDEKELTEELLLIHNQSFPLFIDLPNGELYEVVGFFEYSPYGESQITLLAESIETRE